MKIWCKRPRPDAYGKGTRALELREQGMSLNQIAIRIGSSQPSVCKMIKAAKARREKETATTE